MSEKFVLLYLLITSSSLLQVTRADLTCYFCTDDITGESDAFRPYDPDCGRYDYDGNSTEFTQRNDCLCQVLLYDSGYVSRFMDYVPLFHDGECAYYSDGTTCYCVGDYCNTNSFCSQCGYPKPTPTTEATTEPSALACYNCIECSSVDNSTSVVEDVNYSSCMTTVFISTNKVFRGGSYEDHPDGECIQEGENLVCWCSSDFCNDENFDEIQE